VPSWRDGEAVWETAGPRETEALGEQLGRLLEAGDVLAMAGELGTGKTVLVRGVVAGLGGDPADVHSPSFTLANEYPIAPPADAGSDPGRGPGFAHLDLYRIRDAEELPGIGWDGYLTAAWIVAVEWADRAGAWLPPDHLWIGLERLGAMQRRIRARPMGPRSAARLRAWAASAERAGA
jgi:tRNA threonylcarbamoyladenosine biosynthesis protein TsaE